MNKKFIIIAIALSLPLTVAAFPGEGMGFGGKGVNRIERLAEKLELTDDQKSKLEVILKEQRAKQQVIRDETHDRMGKILTGEQMEQMQNMKKRRQEKRENKKGFKKQY